MEANLALAPSASRALTRSTCVFDRLGVANVEAAARKRTRRRVGVTDVIFLFFCTGERLWAH